MSRSQASPFAGSRASVASVGRWLRRVYHSLPAPPSTNFQHSKLRPSPYELLPANPIIYDIGSKTGQAAYFGGAPPGAKVICTDIAPGPGVDIVADAQHMPQIATESADAVFLVDVLEHLPSPQNAIDEVFRILRPGGVIYVNVPFIFVYHADPEDFRRLSVTGLAALCSRFERIGSGSNRGPASTFCDLLIRFLGILLSFNSEAMYAIVVYIGKWTLFWIKYLDVIIARYPTAYIMAGSSYFLGRKPGHAGGADRA